MQIIGFNFTKILAEKSPDFERSGLNTNIEFTNVIEEKVPILKDSESIKVSFKYSLIYSTQDEKKKEKEEKKGEVTFEGNIVLAVNKEEAKSLQKDWKKRKLPESIKIPLFNLILRKCSIKAAQLQEDVSLPIHLPIPKIAPAQNQKKE